MAVKESRARAWSLGPLAVACTAFGLATWAWGAVGVLIAATIPSLWVRRGLDWSARLQLLSGGAVAAVALLVGPVGAPEIVFPPGGTATLHPLAVRLSLAILAVCVQRRYLLAPAGGVPATLLALAASLVASGYAPWNITYAVLVAAFVVAAMPALRASHGGGPAWQSLDTRRKLAATSMIALTAIVAVGVGTAIPLLHGKFVAAFLAYENARSESGLTDSILLGGSTDIIESDEVILRIQGGRTDYLRGFVLSRYRDGAWLPSEADLGQEQNIETAADARDGRIAIRTAKTEPRFYLPLGARRVATPSGRVVVDRMGLVRALSGKAADVTWFEPSPRDRWPVAPPELQDVTIPQEDRPALERLLAEWTSGAGSTRQKLEQIERHLRSDFRYSLQHEHRTRGDPVLDFLFVHRVGHCEYFASAMALLARTAGVPARVVSGYRVHETNPIGDYWVVRARDAHAWVEAWIEGEGWVTFDPTPPSALDALRGSRTPWLAGLTDMASDLWGRAGRSEAASPGNLAGGIAAAALLAGAAVWLRRRLTDRWGRSVRGAGAVDSTCLPLLADAIARRGWIRESAETIEAFAARVRREGKGAEFAEQAAELLEAYARWCYGGVGDERELERRVRALPSASP